MDVDVLAPRRIDDVSFLSGGGEMGKRIRSFNWDESMLGPVELWPQSLRSALSICLNSSFPIALYWGRDLALLYNDDWAPIPGAKHPWALGRPAREAWADIWDIIQPLFLRVFETGEATRQRDQLLPMQRHGFTEECYFDYTFSPIRGESGKVEGVFNAVIETTGHVIGERRLRTLRDLGSTRPASSASVQTACEHAVNVLRANPYDLAFALVYVTEPDGKTARLMGAAGLPPESASAPGLIRLDTDDVWPLASVLRSGAALEQPGIAEHFGHLRAGAWPEAPQRAIILPLAQSDARAATGFLVLGLSPRLPFNEDYRSFLGLLADHVSAAITAARAYEEERRRAETLAELDRAKTQFFSNVSHELRTPLTLILGPLEDLLAQQGLDAPTRGQLQTVRRNAVRLLKLVNTLLDFSRIEAGRMTMSYEPLDLAAFTAELASSFRSACERAGITLTVSHTGAHETVYADRDLWEKIVLNLLSNAYKFTLSGGISVSTMIRDGQFRLEVTDTGIGIPQADLPRVFERFHRVQNAGGRTHEGTGIGLALVYELVKLHGGGIEVHSEPGEGSTFAISLPLGAAHLDPKRVVQAAAEPNAMRTTGHLDEALYWLPPSAQAATAPQEVRVAPQAARPRILWADDNADMRAYVARLLGDAFEVRSVADGAQALELAQSWLPDLILSDVMMPRLDGFGLLHAIRSEARTSGIPVILLSARAGEEARVEGFQADADDYLVKPFHARELRARVEAQLRISQLRRESNRAKDEFLAMLGHELRNPLAPIMTALYLMRMRDPASCRNEREVIERQVQQLSRLVNDVMDVSRITSGRIEITREPVDMVAVVDSAAEMVAPLIQQRRHRLLLDVDDAFISGDRARLIQVVSNLLTNAARYTPEGGVIEVNLKSDDDSVLLTVKDNGQGIPVELLPRIFDAFTQGRQSLERSSGGLGLGLAICKSLVNLHGGAIQAHSAGPGRGAEFTVRLPVSVGRAQQPAQLAEPPIRAAQKGSRILLVEDNEDALTMVRIVLDGAGYEVMAARSGPAGLTLAREQRPDLAVIDIGLPEMDGYSLATALRREYAQLPVIALTGYGQEKDRELSRRAGISAHLTKPVEPATLAGEIERLLATRKAA